MKGEGFTPVSAVIFFSIFVDFIKSTHERDDLIGSIFVQDTEDYVDTLKAQYPETRYLSHADITQALQSLEREGLLEPENLLENDKEYFVSKIGEGEEMYHQITYPYNLGFTDLGTQLASQTIAAFGKRIRKEPDLN
jgi:hypothetical protein